MRSGCIPIGHTERQKPQFMHCVVRKSGILSEDNKVSVFKYLVTGISKSATAVPCIRPFTIILEGTLSQPPHSSTSRRSGVPILTLNILLSCSAEPFTSTIVSVKGADKQRQR